jgi:hypothetical protein
MNRLVSKWVPVLGLLLSVPAGVAIGATAENCHLDVCVGDRAINVTRDYREVTVIGIDNFGKYVLRFEDNGGVGGNWDRDDLALMQGCSGDLCVGYPAINVTRNYRGVTVVALHANGKYVLRFDDNGQRGGGWDRWDLAVAWGCVSDLCVNDSIYNRTNGRQGVVAAIQTMQAGGSERFVVSYPGLGLGGNWEYDDLVLLSRGTRAYPPERPYCPPGRTYDPRTGRCERDVTYCPPGTHYDPRTDRCESDLPPPPPARRWSCSIYRGARSFNGSGPTRGAAISGALRACAAGRATPPCRAPEATCRQY